MQFFLYLSRSIFDVPCRYGVLVTLLSGEITDVPFIIYLFIAMTLIYCFKSFSNTKCFCGSIKISIFVYRDTYKDKAT